MARKQNLTLDQEHEWNLEEHFSSSQFQVVPHLGSISSEFAVEHGEGVISHVWCILLWCHLLCGRLEYVVDVGLWGRAVDN